MNIQNEDKMSLFQKLREEYVTAERAIKQLDLSIDDSALSSGLFFPAINELRYAGSHIVNSFISSDGIEDLNKAICHCIRAQNDAYDAFIQFRLRELRRFDNEYKSIVISDIIRDYNECKRQINEVVKRNCQPIITEDFSSTMELEANVSLRFRDCEILNAISEVFDSHRDDLNAKLRVERQTRFFRLFGLVFSTSAFIIAILTFIVTLFK